MKIRISTIPPRGITINQDLPLPALQARLAEGTPCGIQIGTAPRVAITVFRLGNGGEVRGSLTASYLQECGRCLEPKPRTMDTSIAYILKPSDDEEECIGEDDIGIAYYQGDHVDLEPLLQEAFLLQLTPFWSPDIDDNERCMLCHKEAHQQDKEPVIEQAVHSPFARFRKDT
jgi:uncharacterized metal-binding protein YceD (DUF177 family)